MAETGQDAVIYAGNNASLNLTLTDAAGEPIDLTGATLEWGWAPRDATAATLTKSSTASAKIDITDAEGGLATVFIVPADTAALTGCEYRHEVRITDATGAVETLLTGIVTIRPSILGAT